MPIRRELRSLYPPRWRELSARVRFECVDGCCDRCGRPHKAVLRVLPDGRSRPARWPDLLEAP